MSQNEARLLLEAWDYFDKNPKSKTWDGLPGITRGEFYRLMRVVTGIEDLIEAKIYLSRFVQGQLGQTVPQTIIEQAREEKTTPSKLEDIKRATNTTRNWINNLKVKSADDLAQRQVNLAQVKVVLSQIEKKEEPPPPPKAKVDEKPIDLYLEPVEEKEPEPLSQEDEKRLQLLIRSVKSDPKTFSENLEASILKTISQEQRVNFGSSAKVVSIETTNRLLDYSEFLKSGQPFDIKSPVWIFASLADLKNKVLQDNLSDPSRVSTIAQEAALLSEHDTNLAKSLLEPVLGKAVVDKLFGKDEEEKYKITTESTEKTLFKINTGDLVDYYENSREAHLKISEAYQKEDFQQIAQIEKNVLETVVKNTKWYKETRNFLLKKASSKFFDKTTLPITEAFTGLRVGALVSIWSTSGVPLLASSTTGVTALLPAISGAPSALVSSKLLIPAINTVVFTGTKGSFSTLGFFTKSGKGLVLGVARGTTGKIAQIGVQLFAKGATKVSVSLALSKVVGAIASFFTTPLGGLVIGAIVGFVLNKSAKILSWIKRNFTKIFAISLVGIGIVVGGPIGTVALLGGGVVGIGAYMGGAKGVASAAYAGIVAITTLTLSAIGVPILVILISIPLAIVLILFIINSGAYLVPPMPADFPSAIESPYVGIEKTASPSSLSRITGEVTIRYRVRIFAKKGALTNINIVNSYQVFSEGNPPLPNPSIDEVDSPPETISPVDDYVFEYEIKLDERYNDSLVIDNLTVSADAPEQSGALASQGASVTIGTPPTGCFEFNETVGPYFRVESLGWASYPERQRKIIEAIAYLSRSSSWLSMVCKGGTVTLTHAQQIGSWGGWAPSATKKDVIFYSRFGITEGSSWEYTVYLFAHESGHIIDYHNPIASSKYRELAAHEGFLPTYPACCRSAAEDLAEVIGRYASKHSILNEPRFSGHKEFGRFVYGIEF